MNAEEFLKRLEFLLSDLSGEEKDEAIRYYRDYLAEAGEAEEANVLAEFGSPERIASIIRADLMGGMDDSGEFTDSGYQDERFEEPRCETAVFREVPEEELKKEKEEQEEREEEEKEEKRSRKKGSLLTIAVVALCVLFLLPALVPSTGILMGIAIVVAGILIVFFFGLGVATMTLLTVDIFFLVSAIYVLFAKPALFVPAFGMTVLLFGLSLISAGLSVLFYWKFLPGLFRKGKDFFKAKSDGRKKS